MLRHLSSTVLRLPKPPLRPFSSSTPNPDWGEERRRTTTPTPLSHTKPHVVHINPRKNNTFVTVSNFLGNKTLSVSVGSLRLGKGSKIPRFFAEPVAEHAAAESVKAGVSSVVVRVKGAVFFRKKRDAVMGWRKGARTGGVDLCRVESVQDVTRLAHNGCRLRKQRRI